MSAAEGSRHGSKHGDSNGRSTNDSPDATDNTDHAAVMSSQQAEDSPASAASSASESDDTTERETTVHLARHGEVLTVRLIESLEAGFANYTWAAARVLAWRILVEQGGSQSRPLHGRTVIELGCGTALPGLVAAQCGARVVLTDADAAGPALQRAQYVLKSLVLSARRVRRGGSHSSILASSALPYTYALTPFLIFHQTCCRAERRQRSCSGGTVDVGRVD